MTCSCGQERLVGEFPAGGRSSVNAARPEHGARGCAERLRHRAASETTTLRRCSPTPVDVLINRKPPPRARSSRSRPPRNASQCGLGPGQARWITCCRPAMGTGAGGSSAHRGLVGTPGARRNRGRGRIHDLRKVGRCARITVKSLERDGPDQEWPTVCRAGSRRKGRRRRRTGEEPDGERGLEPRGTAPSEKPNPWPLHSTSSRSVRIAWSGSIVQGMMVRSTLPV